MKVISLNLPELYIRALDGLVREKKYSSRAAAIRVAVRTLILRHKIWSKKKEKKSVRKQTCLIV